MAEPLASVVDDHAVDPHAAAAALARLAQRTRDAAVGAAAGARARRRSCSLGYQQIALPACAAALTGFFVAAVARGERGALVARLVGQRSAYHIPEVARAAERMASRRTATSSPAHSPASCSSPRASSPPARALDGIAERILPYADDLLGLAFLIASDGVKVHPASLALLDRLLGSTIAQPALQPRDSRAAPAHRDPAHARLDRRLSARRERAICARAQPIALSRPRARARPHVAGDLRRQLVRAPSGARLRAGPVEQHADRGSVTAIAPNAIDV